MKKIIIFNRLCPSYNLKQRFTYFEMVSVSPQPVETRFVHKLSFLFGPSFILVFFHIE